MTSSMVTFSQEVFLVVWCKFQLHTICEHWDTGGGWYHPPPHPPPPPKSASGIMRSNLREGLHYMQKNRFSKVNNSLLELKETELKDREVKKKRTWYDRLINNISEPKRKIVGGFKVFLRQTHLKIIVK